MDALSMSAVPATLHPVEGELPYALAPSQRGLWLLHQVSPDCGAFHLLFTLSVAGPALQWRSASSGLLHSLMEQHPLLRARMHHAQAGPVQSVDPAAQPDVCWIEATALSTDALREQIRCDARAPFNLEQAPLWRVHIYRQPDESWVIAVVAHHLLLDFWSLGLLLAQGAAWWGVLPAGGEVDGQGFLSWSEEKSNLKQTSLPAQQPWFAHWQQTLEAAPPVHSLPLDHARSAHTVYEGKSQTFRLSPKASAALHALAKTQQATPFMVLLTVYAAWLHRLSGDHDFVIASPVAGRTQRAQRQMLGQFVNTLPLRVKLSGDESFTAVLARVRHTVIEALRHGDVPFADLVAHFAPPREAGVEPLAQLGFSWERLPLMADFADFFLPLDTGAVFEAQGLRLTPFAVPQQEGQLELQMEMGGEHEGCLVGVLKYRTPLFADATISHWLRSWVQWVDAVVAAPEQALGVLPLWQGLKDALPDRGAQPPLPDHTALQEWCAVVQARPEAIAVEDGQGHLTHAQLMDRAQAIATGLQALGVQPGSHVGLMVDRDRDLPAAILGIWLARAAYVPLDTHFPRDRLALMGDDAQLSALVSLSHHQALWPSVPAVLCLDQALPAPAQPLAAMGDGGDIAYLIYTSGSTGTPKGVRVGHRSVLNFLRSMRSLMPVDTDTRLLAVTTPAFDISVLELMLPLLSGGAVVVCEQATISDGDALAKRLHAQRINMMQATPASWKMLISAGWTGTPHLVALCGGEPLPAWLADELHPRCRQLWNVYGPTETTVWSTAALLRQGEPVHLGEPIHHTQLHVLDAMQQPVPPGVLGELWIGGQGLAVDYWLRPELTAERFTALPSLPHAGRLYRTGDRVRWNAQGRLEHHGRLDFQVKLRGFRIELGEIETLIKRQCTWQDAVVVLRDDLPTGPGLVAYVVAMDAASADTAALRQQLQQHLPHYMVPSQVVVLAALPQTPNRKVDRKALPAPDVQARRATLRAPRDALEIQLLAVFERLLQVSPIGIDDNFFDLGGHSLLAVQVVAEVQRLLQVQLPVGDLMLHGSVAALAEKLRSGASGTPALLLPLTAAATAMATPAPAPAPTPTPTRTDSGEPQPLWLFHPIGGNVFCYLELSRRLAPGRPVWAVQSPGLDQAGEAEVTVPTMATRYLQALQAVQPQGPYLLGGWCFGGVVAFEAARQLQAQGQVVSGVVMIDSRAPVLANIPSDGDDATLLSWFARDLATPFGKQLLIDPQDLRALEPDAMFNHVLAAAQAIDVLAADADPAQLQRYFESYLANGIALQTYLPEPPSPPLPLLLLRAQDEPGDWGPTLGWHELVGDALRMLDVSGDHNTVVQAPHAATVASLIDQHHPCNAVTPLPMQQKAAA